MNAGMILFIRIFLSVNAMHKQKNNFPWSEIYIR